MYISTDIIDVYTFTFCFEDGIYYLPSRANTLNETANSDRVFTRQGIPLVSVVLMILGCCCLACVSTCMCTCVCVYVYATVYVHTYIYARMRAHTQIHSCTHRIQQAV